MNRKLKILFPIAFISQLSFAQLFFSENFEYSDYELFKLVSENRKRWAFFHSENQDFNNNRMIDSWEDIKSIDFVKNEEGNTAIQFRLNKMNRGILEEDVMKNGEIDGEKVDYHNFFTHIARNEISTWDDPDVTSFKIGKIFEFEFDIYIPTDFEFEIKSCDNLKDANYDLVAQWLASYGFGVSSGSRFPILSLRIVCNQWVLNQNPNNDEESQIYSVIPGEVSLGKWVNWKFKMKFSEKDKGFVYLWKDGELVYSYRGKKTIFTKSAPNGRKGTLYFKIGVYKPHWWSRNSNVTKRVVIFDNIGVKRGRKKTNL